MITRQKKTWDKERAAEKEHEERRAAIVAGHKPPHPAGSVWPNPVANRARAELALHAVTRVLKRLHDANFPDCEMKHQLTKCCRWNKECTKALTAAKLPIVIGKKMHERIARFNHLLDTNGAHDKEAAARQVVVALGVASMLVIDCWCNTEEYHNQQWKWLSDTLDTLCFKFLYPFWPDAEIEADAWHTKVRA